MRDRIHTLVQEVFAHDIVQELRDEHTNLHKQYTNWVSAHPISDTEKSLAEKKQYLTAVDSSPEHLIPEIYATYKTRLEQRQKEHAQIQEKLDQLDTQTYEKNKEFLA